MTTKTCETCQAWRPVADDLAGNLGKCHLNPPRAYGKCDVTDKVILVHVPHYSGESCVQHIPIETECEHEFTCCNKPHGDVRFRCVKCGLRKVSLVLSVDKFHTPLPGPHVDDHLPAAKLKDACDKLGAANERIKELEVERATAVDDADNPVKGRFAEGGMVAARRMTDMILGLLDGLPSGRLARDEVKDLVCSCQASITKTLMDTTKQSAPSDQGQSPTSR